MNNSEAIKRRQEQEKRFIAWAESRDDDWWEDEARISIWDFRIMQDFFESEVAKARSEAFEEALQALDKYFEGLVLVPNPQATKEKIKEILMKLKGENG